MTVERISNTGRVAREASRDPPVELRLRQLIIDLDRRTAGDMAWWRIWTIHNHFAELRALDQPALVMRVAAGEHHPADRVELVALHHGLDMVSELIRRGRRPAQTARRSELDRSRA